MCSYPCFGLSKTSFTPPSQLLKLIIFFLKQNCITDDQEISSENYFTADAKIGSENCIAADPEISSQNYSENCVAADQEIGSEN